MTLKTGTRVGIAVVLGMQLIGGMIAKAQSVPDGDTLALIAADCQDDAFPGEPGFQIEVELRMLGLTDLVTGFQAFVEFDDGVLTYRGDLSDYTMVPFPLHIQSIATAEVASAQLNLDGSAGFMQPGTSDDALLATLVFDVEPMCVTDTTVGFRGESPFPSELSFEGIPIPTNLENTDPFALDDAPPMIASCESSQAVHAVNGFCETLVTFNATITDDCCIEPDGVSPSITLPGGNAMLAFDALDDCTIDQVDSTTVAVSCTAVVAMLTSCPATVEFAVEAADCCSNATQCVSTAEVEDDMPPELECPPDLTIVCGESSDPSHTGIATAMDNCDFVPMLSFSDSVVPGSCPQGSVIVRTWTTTDACGNAATCDQVIEISEAGPPIVTCSATPLAGGDDNDDDDAWDEDSDGTLLIEFDASVECMEGYTISAIIDIGCAQFPVENGQVIALECDDGCEGSGGGDMEPGDDDDDGGDDDDDGGGGDDDDDDGLVGGDKQPGGATFGGPVAGPKKGIGPIGGGMAPPKKSPSNDGNFSYPGGGSGGGLVESAGDDDDDGDDSDILDLESNVATLIVTVTDLCGNTSVCTLELCPLGEDDDDDDD